MCCTLQCHQVCVSLCRCMPRCCGITSEQGCEQAASCSPAGVGKGPTNKHAATAAQPPLMCHHQYVLCPVVQHGFVLVVLLCGCPVTHVCHPVPVCAGVSGEAGDPGDSVVPNQSRRWSPYQLQKDHSCLLGVCGMWRLWFSCFTAVFRCVQRSGCSWLQLVAVGGVG